MVYAEATSVLPLMISYVYHKGDWRLRKGFEWAKHLDK
jgi:deoxyhypusine synthase